MGMDPRITPGFANLARTLTLRRAIFALIWAVTFAVSWILLLPEALYGRPMHGLDPSWNIGVQLAIKNGLIFGKDIIFTYGPLGYLATRLPIGVSTGQFVLFDLLVSAVLAWVLALALGQLRSYWHLFLAFLAALMLSGYQIDYPSGITTLLLFLVVILLCYQVRKRSLLMLITAAVISVVALNVKLNTGLPAFAAVLAYLTYEIIFPRRYSRRFSLALAVVYGMAIVITSRWLNADLTGYVLNSLYVISSHNEGMFLSPSIYEGGVARLTMAVALLVALSGATFGNIRDQRREPSVWFVHGLAAVFMFEIFKHGFSRADFGHNIVFFIFAPAMIGSIYLVAQPEAQARLAKVFVLALIFSAAVLGPILALDGISSRVDTLKNYLHAAQEPMDETVPASLRRTQALPEDVLATIGNAEVDIVPWEISVIYANDLNYNPRPIMQSYAALSGYLDGKNAAKFASKDGPTYVLFSVGDIDERHPFATESQTKLALLANYEVIQRFGPYLLLQKRAQPRLVVETAMPPRRAQLGETIALERGGVQVLSADIGYSLLGRLMTTFYQPPPLQSTVIFSDGEERTYRAVRGIVNGGMIVTPFVEQLEQAEIFFDLGQGRQIAGIRFDSPAPWAYRNEYTWQIKHVEWQGQLQDSTRMKLLGLDAIIPPWDPNVLFDGWHPPESQDSDTCRWSDGASARLFFRVEPFASDEQEELTIEITAGTHQAQTIPVMLNGATIGVIESSTHWDPALHSFVIDPALLQTVDGLPQVNELEFRIPDAMSPASYNEDNGDTRVLGLCLWQMRLRR